MNPEQQCDTSLFLLKALFRMRSSQEEQDPSTGGCVGSLPGSSQETKAGREWFLFPYHHILPSALTTAPFTPFTASLTD
ncbi:hypothetical protein NQZ68_031142 [Dissostichus eleginoides]|nr:hypothetical protein NQZ68_031142 [Dissostichus eleginoides]